MKEIQFHPIALKFPLLSVAEIKTMAQSVRQYGLLNPITIFEGKILDGRHRYEACLQSGVTPRFVTYRGNDAFGFALAANDTRRHMTAGQRAALALEYANLRQGERTDLAEPFLNSGKVPVSQAEAASKAGVSLDTLTKFKRVADESPKLAAQVRDGKLTVHAAAEKLAEKKAEEKPDLDEVGFPIPHACVQYFRRSGEIQELLTAISRIKTKLETKRAEDDVLFRNISQAVVNELALAYSFVANAKPYAVCLNCQGKLKDSCRGCKGTGFMAKFAYEHEQVKGLRTMREAVMSKGKK